MNDEPTIPALITVGHGRFHAGVKVSTVQGAIDRMAVRLQEFEKAVSPLPDDVIDLLVRAREASRWHEAEGDLLPEGIFNDMIAALESLSASPLPEEIAEIKNRHDVAEQSEKGVGEWSAQYGWDAHADRGKLLAALEQMARKITHLTEPSNPPLTMNDALALLNAQAREIERLETESNEFCQGMRWQAERAVKHQLERDDYWHAWKAAMKERDAAKAGAEMWREAALGKAPVNAIRAKTIEECTQIALMFMDSHDTEGPVSRTHTALLVHARQAQTAQDIAKAIRALNPPPEAGDGGEK